MTRILLTLGIVLALAGTSLPQHNVEAQSSGVYYIVQPNDSLSSISAYFHTSAARIALANYITNMNVLEPGTHLLIPGFNDLSGTLTPITIGLGDTPLSLMRQSRSDPSAFTRINFLTSDGAVLVGQKLFTLTKNQPQNQRIPVTDGLTSLELAASEGINPWTAAEYNSLPGPWYLIANDILYLPSSGNSSGGQILPGITSLTMNALGQGKTAVFSAKSDGSAQLSGNLTFTVVNSDEEQTDPKILNTGIPLMVSSYPLNLFPNSDGTLEALQGVPRMTVPGPATLILTSKTADGRTYTLQQNVPVKKVDYGYDSPLQVADSFVDPKVTIPEENFLEQLVAPATPQKMWHGALTNPSPTPDCMNSTYGRLRSFNGSDWIYYHSGLDLCGGTGTPIYAAADGTVVYTGLLDVRGNATIIDHGRGVYTAYYHQSKFEVAKGDQVKAGQVIGLIGATGRVTGPHLHFEILVGDVQVDPTDWLEGLIP